jgi:hypothetical protein
MAHGLSALAGVFSLLGEAQQAARSLGASDAESERVGAFHHPTDRPEAERIITAVRAQLDAATFDAAWAEGRKAPLEQVVAEALGERG